MYRSEKGKPADLVIFLSAFFLTLTSVIILYSIIPSIFPQYYFYVLVAFVTFFLFSRANFLTISAFSNIIYGICVFLLVLPLLIGQITRGAVRWIPLGPVSIQPSELVRPFLVLFFANYLTTKELTFKRLIRAGLLFSVPLLLILIQPSLGVATLTAVSFLGVLFASTLDKKIFLFAFLAIFALLPLIWFTMAPYQKERIVSFLDPSADPRGAGYNSIQSMISVGSGGIDGRGLGQGVQTQLSFLPERHNDFIFASIAEELGFLGVIFVLFLLFVLLFRITFIIEKAGSIAGRAFVSGIYLVMFFQIIFNIGMNMGLFPITGIPLPLLSAGGSSLIATSIALGMISNVRRLK